MSVDFTEQWLAEEPLKESEEKFRSLVDQSPFSIALVSPDGRLEQVNRALMELWGITEEALPEFLEKYNMLEDQEAVWRGVMPLIEKAFQGEEVTLPLIEYDAGTMMDDLGVNGVPGNKRWIQARLYPIMNAMGEVVNVVDMEEDITERMQAVEALKESEEKFRQLMEQAPMSIQVMAPDGRITSVNQAWMELWGFSEEGARDILENYNMLEDEQARERGVMPLIEKAFKGESVVLPVIEYDSRDTMTTMGLKAEGSRSRTTERGSIPMRWRDGPSSEARSACSVSTNGWRIWAGSWRSCPRPGRGVPPPWWRRWGIDPIEKHAVATDDKGTSGNEKDK